jgi:uncharacterized protein
LFSWDETKNKINQQKHGLSFDTAKLVFFDASHLSCQDRIENGELRWQTLGVVGDMMVLLVAHTWQHEATGQEHIRIISARLATKLERKIYEQNI